MSRERSAWQRCWPNHRQKWREIARKGSDIFHINGGVPAETNAIIISFVIAVAIAAAQSMLASGAGEAR
jgi:hypothetical protein